MTNLMLSSITVLFLLGWISEVESNCVDLVSCGKAKGQCHLAAVKNNCKNMCGTCPGSSKNAPTKKTSAKQPQAKQPQSKQPQSKQQTCTDHANCFNWNKNGFCSSPYRTEVEKKKYCPNACNLCDTTNGGPKNTNGGNTNGGNTNNEIPYEFFAQSIQENVDPCQDFYQFTCGKYMKNNQPSKGESYSRFIDHTRTVETQLKNVVFSNSSTNSQAVKLLRQFRDTCMDTNTIESDLTKNLLVDLKAMGDIPMLMGAVWPAATFNLTAALIEMNKRSGHNFLFNIDLTSDAKGVTSLLFSPMNLIITDASKYTDPAMIKKIDALKVFIADIINRIGQDMGSTESFANVKKAVDDVVALEVELSKMFDSEQIDDPATMETTLKAPKKVSDFTTLLKTNPPPQLQLDLDVYLKANVLLVDPQIQTFLATDPQAYIHTEEFFKQATVEMNKDVPRLVNYLFIQYILRQVPYLDSRFSAAANRFAFQLDGSNHVSTRDQDCFDMVRINFPLALDHLYSTKNVDAKTQTSATKVMDKMRESFGKLIRNAKWMEDGDKKYAIQKLGAVKEQIGAIEEAKTKKKLDVIYSVLKLGRKDTFLSMAAKVSIAQGQIKYSKLIKANSFTYDRNMASDSLGVNFINEQNELFIPAAVLQTPFLNVSLPAPVTYGALGFLYGLGLSHGFDKQGGDFDANGVKRSWWSKQTKSAFKKQKQCVFDLYDGVTEPVTSQNIDGKKTLNENIADSGAIRGAFEAYKSYSTGQSIVHVPGYSKYSPEQTFFISYGTMMCASLNSTYQEDLIKNSDYAPSRFRVNTVLSNYPEFSKAFKCKAGSKMVELPCSVW